MLNDRLQRAWEGWKAREITSMRLVGTAVGLVLLAVPIGLWSIVVGPTAGDRLTALVFTLVALGLAGYSLWECKATANQSRPRPREDEP
jgi:thiol:disulfide interchange protein